VINLEDLLCENIKFEELFIDTSHNIIKLFTAFEYCGYKYDGYFRYSKEWDLYKIFHAHFTGCHLCNKLPGKEHEGYRCIYLWQYKNKIEKEIMANDTIKEKLKNFRLEAITAGFNY
jgi:hypothetical protein